jgi:L-asparaginase
VKCVLETPNIEAVLIEGFGAGNTSTDSWFIELLEKASAKGILIFDITQCGGGTVQLGRYETSKHLSDIGVISGYDITFEAAITKLMYLLANSSDRQEQRKLLATNLRGEINYEKTIN